MLQGSILLVISTESHSRSVSFIELQMVELTPQVKVTFTVSQQVNRIPCSTDSTVHCPSKEHNINGTKGTQMLCLSNILLNSLSMVSKVTPLQARLWPKVG